MNELPLFGQYGRQPWAHARQALTHVAIALLAVGIAFSLPVGAEYFLYHWWPRMTKDANNLVVTEIALAGTLLLLFNLARVAWDNRQQARVANAAALVYAREKRGYFARWEERRLLRRLPPARDAYVLTLTGFNTFADPSSLLYGPLANSYEIRVMLLNPVAYSARRRVDSLPQEVTLRSFAMEVEASIAYLSRLRARGKKVTLKFYEQEPFWKVVVLGDHVWVQYCHSGFEVRLEPEYVFALNRGSLRRGLFVPFYMHFLEQWSDARHPLYDFDTCELVYHDGLGQELRRTAFGVTTAQPDAGPPARQAPERQEPA